VYSGRRVAFGTQDPKLARQLFIQQALVEGQLESTAPFYLANQALLQEIRQLEHQSRRPDVLVDEALIYAFYDARIDESVCSAASLDAWRKQVEAEEPRRLFLSRDELMRHEAAGVTTDFFPKVWVAHGADMALSYHFEPGSPRDGVTLTVPLMALGHLDALRCEWLVPGMLKEKVHLLLKSLPQRLRRHCVPLPQYASDFVGRHESLGDMGNRGSLIDALIADVRRETSVDIAPTDFKPETLPAHLSMNFKVIDEHGRQLGMGRNLAQLRAQFISQAQAAFAQTAEAKAGQQLADSGRAITDWDFEPLPQLLEIERDGLCLVGFPALVDCSEYCEIKVFDDAEEAAREHRAGLHCLFRVQLKAQIKFLEKNLINLQTLAMQAAGVPALQKAFANFEAMRDALVSAALDRVALMDPLPVDAASFSARKDEARGRLNLVAQELSRLLATVVSEAVLVWRKVGNLKAHPAVVADVRGQLERLFAPQFLLQTPAEQLAHFPRYLKAIHARLDKLRDDPARDAARMNELAPLETRFLRELAQRKGVSDPKLDSFRWLLEELRVALFAQQLRTPMPVSVKRLQKVWDGLRG
ncbi:MAG TPA: DUF3418 domain-containing protein, partial [Burkholderiaceae bacterium]|nr:DUF3418 domain-containing protein [Burkholderiaceae bacterium]